MADLTVTLGNNTRTISYNSTGSGGGLLVQNAGVGDYYRLTTDGSNTVSSIGPLTGTSGTIPAWTNNLPAASGSTSTSVVYTVQGSDDGVAWANTDQTFTLTRNAIPAPSDISFTDPNTFGTSVTITMAGVGGSGTYEYSANGSTGWSASNTTFAATRGVQFTWYARSTFSGQASSSISRNYTPVLDTTPDGYSTHVYTDQTDVGRNTTRTSATAYVVAGLNAPATISVSGTGGSNHQYGINGVYSSTNGSVQNGQSITARHTSSGNFSTTATTTVTIGGVSRTFSSTTVAQDTTPDAFSFTPVTGALASTVYSTFAQITGITGNVTVTRAGVSGTAGEFSISATTTPGTWGTTGTITDGQYLHVRITSGAYNTTSTTNYTVGTSTQAFSVSTIVPPTVGPQTYLTTVARYISHNISASGGSGGTLEYAISTSATYNTSLIYGWSTSNAFTATASHLERGQTYYFWARRADAAGAAASFAEAVPFLATDSTINSIPDATIGAGVTTWTVEIVGGSQYNTYEIRDTDINGTLRGDRNDSGTLTIDDATFSNIPGATKTYAVTAYRSLTNGGSGLANRVLVQSDSTYVVTREDAQPDNFTFNPDTNVARSTTRTSNTITISGLGAGVTVPVTVTGDASSTFSINSGAFGTTGSVTNGSTLAVRHTSSASYNTIVSSTISVGGTGQEVVRAFTSTTLQQPPTGINYSLTDPAVKDNDVTVSMAATGGVPPYEYSIDGVAGWTTTNTFAGVRGTLYNRYARSTGPSSPAGPFSYTPPYLDPPSTITNSGWSTTAPAYNNVNDITFTVTVPETGNGVYYQLRRDSISPVGFFDGAAEVGLTKVVTLSYPQEIPPPNITYTYAWRAQRYSPQGGTGVYGSNITSGTNPTFTITRDNIPAPTGLTASSSGEFDANPSVTVSASGGINLDYNITFGPTLPSTGWGAGPFTATTDTLATLTRGSIYYIWARSNYTYDGVNYTRAISDSYTVPYIQPDLTLTAGSQTTFVTFNNTNNIFYGWTGNTDPTRYIIEREGPPNTWSFATLAEKNSTGRTLIWAENDIPPPGQSANYRVSANVLTVDGGSQIWSPTNLSWTLARGLVSPPTSITITPSSSPEPTIQVSVLADPIYGTAEYSLSSSSGFSSSNTFNVIRGSAFSVFARNAYLYTPDANTYYSSPFNAVLNPIPFLSPDTTINAISAINISPGATSYTVGITNGETHTVYEIRDASYTGTILGQVSGAGTGTANIVINNVPAQGATKTYYITGFRTINTGGQGSPGVQNVTTFDVNSVIIAPIVQNTQTFTNETQGVIDHTIAMTSLGEGSPIQYAISKSATYNTSVVRTWQSSASFTGANGVRRGSPYYFWARITDNAAYADASLENTVPFLSPPNSVTSSPTSFSPIASNDTTDRSIELKAVSVNTSGVYYRFRRTNGISPVSIGSYEPTVDGALPKNILISPTHLPPQGATWTYYWEAQRYIFAGGDAEYDPVTGSGSSFTITREAADTTPSPFDFPDIGRVALNTIVYTNELQITGFDSSTSISITGQGSPEYKISNSAGTSPDAGTWTSAAGTISPDKYVRLRHRSSNISDTTLTSTVTIGGVQDSFTSQSFRMPVYNLGNITLNGVTATNLDISPSIAFQYQVVVGWTSPDSSAHYRITRLDYDQNNNPNPTSVREETTSLGQNSLTLYSSPTNLDVPSQGHTGSYRIQIRVPTAQGGNNTWYAARRPNGDIAAFSLVRFKFPAVLDGQSFDKYTNTATISHLIQMSDLGYGGTLEYNVTTNSTYPVSGWQTSNIVNLTRNTTYWLWARRNTASFNPPYDSSGTGELVPLATQAYGLQVFTAAGVPILDLTSRMIRTTVSYADVSVGAYQTTSYISIPSILSPNDTSVIVTPPEISPNPYPDYGPLFDLEVNYIDHPTNPQTIRIFNGAGFTVVYRYYVFKTG